MYFYEKVLFKVHLEKSVHRGFIDEVRDRMLKSLSALLEKEFKREQVNEILSGAIIVDEVEEPVRSFFNIPLAIGDRVVGVLTVSDTKAGLYKEEEMTILYKITSQASKAVTKLQEVVKTEQSKLNAMVESMADGVVMTDLDYRVMVVNPSAKNIIGWQGKNEVTIFDFIDKLGNTFDIRGKLEESVKLNKSYILDKILINDKFFREEQRRHSPGAHDSQRHNEHSCSGNDRLVRIHKQNHPAIQSKKPCLQHSAGKDRKPEKHNVLPAYCHYPDSYDLLRRFRNGV